MSRLNCNVVKDILPLYADEVVCEDTKQLMEEHLEECEGCRGELAAMREKVIIPVQTDAAESVKEVKKKWGKKQLWKGIGIAAAIAVVLAGVFFYFYGYGIPVKAEDVILKAGLQCQMGNDENGEPITDQSQVWAIDIDTVDGRTITSSEWVHQKNANGEEIYCGVRIYVRRALFCFPWDYDGAIRHGMASSTEYTEEQDFTITVVCSDAEITYSMKDEGLWDLDAEHSAEFCVECRR